MEALEERVGLWS